MSSCCQRFRASRGARAALRLRGAPAVLVLSLVALIAGAEPARAQGSPIEFSAIGDAPYSVAERDEFAEHVANHNLYSPSQFFVHLGDVKGGDPTCQEADYVAAANLLSGLAVPTFVVPGDNEWTDCNDPAQAWSYWTSHFLGFEQNYCGLPAVESQLGRPENFAFVEHGVLFVGINHVGGTNADPLEEAARLLDDVDWIDQQMQARGAVVRAAVVFAQESPLVEPFESGFRAAAAAFGKPVAYIHGDNHAWIVDFPFPETNVMRVQVERGTLVAPPIRVTVTMDQDPAGAFAIERDPWPAGTPVLNRPPCVEAGPDLIADIAAPPLLVGRASDDGVPGGAFGTLWSAVSGPGSVIFDNIFALSATPDFGAPGVYQLRLEADDGELTSQSDVYVLVRGLAGEDGDADGSDDDVDNCPAVANPGQADADGDGFGDDCDPDLDGDGYPAAIDCDDSDPAVNPSPVTAEVCGDAIDNNCDGATDAADLQCGACPAGFDGDGDGVCSWDDVCPLDYDPGQEDADGDGAGDLCDVCPASATIDVDPDGDGLCQDNCPAISNPGQEDGDGDGVGDVCDACGVDGTGGSCSPIGYEWEGQIALSADDAEERESNGSVTLGSSDLELGRDGNNLQIVGLRFPGVAIEQGATIDRAYLQFQVDEADAGPAVLMIEGEAADDSAPFAAAPGNLGSRLRTAAWAGWAPADWNTIGERGARQRSSELAGVLQEIVDRPGWTSGSALTLIVSALDVASVRVAEAFDGSVPGAPLLHVEHSPSHPIVSIGSPPDGASVIEGELVTFAGSALDPQEGDISAGLLWDSDLDGPIGSGAGFASAALSVGAHTITATASDSESHEGSDSIALTVLANATPVVSVSAPLAGGSAIETESVDFAGAASDAEDGDLSAGIAWSSDLDGALGSGPSFSLASLSVGSHLISASVVDSHGKPGSDQVAFTVLANAPPVVTILSPEDGASAVETDLVGFGASASDAEDGDLSAGLAWTSDLDGAIGGGASFGLASLSPGTHLISASVVDAHGAPGEATIELTVEENTPPVVTISDPAPYSSTAAGSPLTFTASADDLEDGDLAGELVWSSDLDGEIGTGGSFVTATLSIGTHLVTASAMDSHGQGGSDEVVTIRLPEPGSEGLLAGLLGLALLARRRCR